ncbi:MAG: magnesium/cobalt transporter CorA [Candidatus Abyssubacteria bacterium]
MLIAHADDLKYNEEQEVVRTSIHGGDQMPKLIKKRIKKIGAPPGTLVHIGTKKEERPRITVIDYDESTFEEKQVDRVEECFVFKDKPTVTWINIDGIHEVALLEKLGQCYGVHPLILEDILNTDQRPKMDDMDEYIFIVLKMLFYNHVKSELQVEQVSIVFGKNFVISFQERQGDVFDPIRERIRTRKGRVRMLGADYLAYALLDVIIDNYFIVLEKLGETIEELEENFVTEPTQASLRTLHELKREGIFLRKAIWPLRELVAGLERGESDLIQDSTRPYLRDLYDHAVQLIDTTETFQQMLSGLHDIYLSSASNRMNEIMKVLTIIATIFIPLSFVAGIYGMNFQYMPETQWHWGYFGALGVMAVAALGMLYFFKRKGWI